MTRRSPRSSTHREVLGVHSSSWREKGASRRRAGAATVPGGPVARTKMPLGGVTGAGLAPDQGDRLGVPLAVEVGGSAVEHLDGRRHPAPAVQRIAGQARRPGLRGPRRGIRSAGGAVRGTSRRTAGGCTTAGQQAREAASTGGHGGAGGRPVDEAERGGAGGPGRRGAARGGLLRGGGGLNAGAGGGAQHGAIRHIRGEQPGAASPRGQRAGAGGEFPRLRAGGRDPGPVGRRRGDPK